MGEIRPKKCEQGRDRRDQLASTSNSNCPSHRTNSNSCREESERPTHPP